MTGVAKLTEAEAALLLEQAGFMAAKQLRLAKSIVAEEGFSDGANASSLIAAVVQAIAMNQLLLDQS